MTTSWEGFGGWGGLKEWITFPVGTCDLWSGDSQTTEREWERAREVQAAQRCFSDHIQSSQVFVGETRDKTEEDQAGAIMNCQIGIPEHATTLWWADPKQIRHMMEGSMDSACLDYSKKREMILSSQILLC